MKKYKTGDVAALFSKPKEGSTESGKKLKSLFDDFYSKSKKKPNRSQSPINSQNTSTENEKFSPQIVKKNKKKDKQRKSFDAIPSSKEVNIQSEQSQLPPQVHQEIDFPRRKPKRNRNSHTVNETPELLQNDISLTSNENNTSRKKSNKKKKFLKDDLFSEDTGSSFQKKKNKQEHLTVLKPAVESDLEGSDLEGTFETSIRELNKNPVVKKKNKRKFDQALSEEPDIEAPPMKLYKANSSQHSTKCVTEAKSPKTAANKKNKLQEGADFLALKTPKVQTEETLRRTVFVGNLPLNFTKKSLQKLFSPFGALETMRLRGAIPQKPSMPKKVAEIKGKYHSKQHSLKAYVVFQKEKEAMESLTLNGTVIEDHHIVVDIAKQVGDHKMYDNKKSVFVGNLPFDIADEMLWSSFEHCDVEAVRVIRDRETGAGKGFGYILFHDTEGRDKALTLKDIEINGRTIRIKPVEKQDNRNSQQKPQHWSLAKKRAFEERNKGSKKSVKKIIKKGKLSQQKKNIAKFLTKQQN